MDDYGQGVVMGPGQLKVDSFAWSECIAKWNEALRSEEALG
jgi:hypothetical protein